MEDSQIIELYENRDEQAIVETSRKYRNYCQSISYNILHNTADCDECINDALHRLWNSIPPEHPTSFSSYLAKIVRNCSLDKYRYKKSRYFDQTIAISEELENCLTNHISAENIVEEKRIISLINVFLKNLDKEKRVMFVKRY